jgi:hypothetical protein
MRGVLFYGAPFKDLLCKHFVDVCIWPAGSLVSDRIRFVAPGDPFIEASAL